MKAAAKGALGEIHRNELCCRQLAAGPESADRSYGAETETPEDSDNDSGVDGSHWQSPGSVAAGAAAAGEPSAAGAAQAEPAAAAAEPSAPVAALAAGGFEGNPTPKDYIRGANGKLSTSW